MTVLVGLEYRGRTRSGFVEHVEFCLGAKDLLEKWKRGSEENKISIFPSTNSVGAGRQA